MLPYIDRNELRRLLPYPELVAALRAAFQSPIQAPLRHVHTLSADSAATLLLMPAWQAQAMAGVKLVTVARANAARDLPTVHSVFILLDTETGVPLALLDGEELTLRRTAAASALASSFLSRTDSQSLLIVGTGRLAPYMAAAHCVARPITEIRIWGRSAERARQAIQQLRMQGVPPHISIECASDLPSAVNAADIISCATTSKVPLVHAHWVKAGTHVDLVGGFKPDMREADDALMTAADLFVDTYAGALAEAGDLVQPISSGKLQQDAIIADLAALCCGRHPGRTTTDQITLFKSVGTAIEDLGAAQLAWRALTQGPRK